MAQQAYPPCKNPRAASHFRGADCVLERINPKLHLNNYAFDLYKPYSAPIHSDNLFNIRLNKYESIVISIFPLMFLSGNSPPRSVFCRPRAPPGSSPIRVFCGGVLSLRDGPKTPGADWQPPHMTQSEPDMR